MNPLEEHPHLFANGKFKYEHSGGNIYWFWPNSLRHKPGGGFFLHGGACGDQEIEDCTLIARPIEDMTDEECREIIPITGIPYDVETFKEDYSEMPIENLTVAEFNAFCDIGVVNWSQLFEDGTIIKAGEQS